MRGLTFAVAISAVLGCQACIPRGFGQSSRQRVRQVEDSIVFEAALTAFDSIWGKPDFLDPRPIPVPSQSIDSALASHESLELAAQRRRILVRLGISTAAAVFPGGCAGYSVPESRRATGGCPSQRTLVVQMSPVYVRGTMRLIHLAILALGTKGSTSMGEDYVFAFSNGHWSFLRREPGTIE